MFKTFTNAWKLPDLKKKILFTLIVILVYRIGCALPVPFIDADAIKSMFSSAEGTIFQYFNILSGDSFSKATLFALSVTPYITASIVMQLLTIAIPALEKLQKSGEEGQKKIAQITRVVTVGLALLTSFGYYTTLKNATHALTDTSFFAGLVIVSCHCAGACIIMWLGEKIDEKGIGNGISMILFANIISALPTMIAPIIATYELKGVVAILVYAAAILIGILVVAFVVFMTDSERRLPIQYSKRVVGRKMYGGQSTFLPIKLNMSGVMPIIFASSIMQLPATIALFLPTPEEGSFWAGFLNFFSTRSVFYAIILLVLIIAFSYFYLAISFNPVEVANNLKQNGGFIPGIRPGKPTSDYISKSLKRITLIGAFFLAIIAVMPMVLSAFNVSFGSVSFGGTSLLIVVGVALETTRDLESQITMRHYKGFLE